MPLAHQAPKSQTSSQLCRARWLNKKKVMYPAEQLNKKRAIWERDGDYALKPQECLFLSSRSHKFRNNSLFHNISIWMDDFLPWHLALAYNFGQRWWWWVSEWNGRIGKRCREKESKREKGKINGIPEKEKELVVFTFKKDDLCVIQRVLRLQMWRTAILEGNTHCR